MNQRILVIDDDGEYTQLLKTLLELRDYEVIIALCGAEGLRIAPAAAPDLVILDIMMCTMDGWEVCRRLREASDVPIMIVTACATSQYDIAKGLSIGADGYLTKPFRNEELLARIEAILRRSGNGKGRWSVPSSVQRGDVTVDFGAQTAKVRGKEVDLSPTEYRLLSCLVRNEGRVLPHRYLLEHVWGPEYKNDVDYIKVYVRYLRCKIEEDPSEPVYIKTRWGVGYEFTAA
jgi:two-component system KDP operon response regulator KdpE